MCVISGDLDYVVMGLKDGLVVLDALSGESVDRWENAEMDVVSVTCEMLTDDIALLAILDNNGIYVEESR